jgi:hypothetical protein
VAWALLSAAAGVGKNSTRSSESEQGDSDARKHDVMQHMTTFSSIQASTFAKSSTHLRCAALFENIQAAANLSSNQIG